MLIRRETIPSGSRGVFVVSLDFELYWGVRDILSIDDYKEKLLGARKVIPILLNVFEEYKIHATWATVGFLFCHTKDELLSIIPDKKPLYENTDLSPYSSMDSIGENEVISPFHFAGSLVKLILSTKYQEIGTHTLSHYSCLEKGQNIDCFREDVATAVNLASRYNIDIKSFVFPKDQYSETHVRVLKKLGIKSYRGRGNERSWIYAPRKKEYETLVRRGIRLLDVYFNISGYNTYKLNNNMGENLKKHLPVNIPSSRFLKPYSKKLGIFEPLRLKRILSSLNHAAKYGEMYHLCWHPHNFGSNLSENIEFLKKILDEYLVLKKKYGIESLSLGELSR